ncbi:BTAD domain-containing putative transcriptional regulator [Actinocrispum sp. NPDC049592]|uniref:AfsR/SARP family transcriptional regulator n=1 Tax=Actinocrispum sp. NPDC049592 TaxID=3154835 RepID=UPI00341C2239
MRVLMLGPVELRAGGKPVPLGGAKPRTLLAALMTNPRAVVSIDQLISSIWDETPPRSATALVHTYVSALRRAFTTAGNGSVLVTQPPGYRLDIAPEDNDLEAFAQLLSAGRRLERDGDYAEAATRYEQALELWRGSALGGVDADFARNRAVALEEDRLTVEEGLARCELAQHRTAEAAARMAKVTAAHPLREEARGVLMRALYESGRQADALAVYREGRKHLLDELGVEPGEKLQQLHNDVLTGTLDPLVTETAYTTPRHLPPDIGDFTGRDEQLDFLVGLAEQAIAKPRTATPTVVVSGFGGAGKSALAVHTAHLLAGKYADGQLFADLRGADPELGVRDALRRFLSALGVSGADLPDTVDDRVELYRRKVAGRSLIVVLDNVTGEHQVRRLLPGSPRCLVIITSRSRLTGLEGAEVIELDFLRTDASVTMLSTIVGAPRINAEPEAAATIARLCGGIPLAIRAAAAKLRARPHWPVRALAGRLSDERRRLDELAVGDLAIRSSLQLNYADLGPDHRTAFHLLTRLDLPDFGAWLAAPLLDITPGAAEDIVEHLVDLRLLEVVGIDSLGRVRYRFHDLIQLFGAEQGADEPLGPALNRLLTTWMRLVEYGARQLPRVTLGLRPSASQEKIDPGLRYEVEQDPTEWLKSETAAVVRAVERSHELGVDRATIMLIVSLLASPFAVRNEFDGWQRILDVALSAAQTRQELATVHASLGQLRYEQDDFSSAMAHFHQAWVHAEAAEDDLTQGVARVGMGTVHRELGEFDPAIAHLLAGSELADRAGDAGVTAAAQYGLGAIKRDLGELASAAQSFDKCVALYRELGDQRGEGLALRGVSLCHRAAGEFGKAADQSRQAEVILREAGDALGAAYARQSLAKALLRQRKPVTDLLDSCHQVFLAHRDRFGLALAVRTMGEAALAFGDHARARELLTEALERWSELGLPLWEARTLRDLAAASVATPDVAGAHWARALELMTSVGGREAAELRESSPEGWLARL